LAGCCNTHTWRFFEDEVRGAFDPIDPLTSKQNLSPNCPVVFGGMLMMSPQVKLYTDGGSRGNPGPAAIGIVLCLGDDTVDEEHKEHIGEATNNEAEYQAVLKGLDMAAAHTRKEVVCTSDSEFVIRQLTGAFRLKNERMKRLFDEAKIKEQMFEKVTYRHRPRLSGHLYRADELVNEALDEAGF
jgi:ribonuclease HI